MPFGVGREDFGVTGKASNVALATGADAILALIRRRYECRVGSRDGA